MRATTLQGKVYQDRLIRRLARAGGFLHGGSDHYFSKR